MTTELFQYIHGGVVLSGQLARPAGPGPHPGVLVMHDGLGVGTLVCRRATELAAAGYVALAADMYGVGLSAGDPAMVGELFLALQGAPEHLRARVVATFDALRALPEVDATRIVAIGYCFGGQCVLELARSGAALRAVVSFHGLLTTRLPPQPGAIKARVLSITGAMDPHVPAADVAAFQIEMAAAGADWQSTLYGNGWHAFSDPDVGRRGDVPGVLYDPLLERLSWAQATEFLAAALDP